MAVLARKKRALETYERFRSALADLTEEERMLVDGIYLTPVEQLPVDERS